MYRFSLLGDVPQPLTLKVLDTDNLRRQGFMGWKQPPSDHYGMLFLHPEPKSQSYWMQDVPFDLDCIGFDQDNRVVEILPLKAHEKASKRFSVAVQNVVEVRGGWCAEHGLKAGDKLVMREL